MPVHNRNERMNANEPLFWFEGNLRAVPAHHRHDAAASHLHINAPWRWGDHEEKSAGAEQYRHRHRSAAPFQIQVRLPSAPRQWGVFFYTNSVRDFSSHRSVVPNPQQYMCEVFDADQQRSGNA